MAEQMRCGLNKEYLQYEQSWSWLQQIRMIPLFTFTLSKCAIPRYVFPLWIQMDETSKQLFIVTQSKNTQMHIQWKEGLHFISYSCETHWIFSVSTFFFFQLERHCASMTNGPNRMHIDFQYCNESKNALNIHVVRQRRARTILGRYVLW